ncbi:MAG: hypothetical protein JTT11_04520 [Candidatus Brockarchaeota archaeon]|nr:hypothetical protein [Candidatus Brockarchaeota archaeon]
MAPIREAPVKAVREWKVIARDGRSWACGIYAPKNRSAEEVKFLEKHDCPELFYLLHGSVKLVVMRRGRMEVIPLTREKAVVVDTWHNGFSDGEEGGAALVVERGKVSTRYMKLKKG